MVCGRCLKSWVRRRTPWLSKNGITSRTWWFGGTALRRKLSSSAHTMTTLNAAVEQLTIGAASSLLHTYTGPSGSYRFTKGSCLSHLDERKRGRSSCSEKFLNRDS